MIEGQTKYKTVDKKVKHVVAPLSSDCWQWIKGVVVDPSLRDPQGHWFSDKTIGRSFTFFSDYLGLFEILWALVYLAYAKCFYI